MKNRLLQRLRQTIFGQAKPEEEPLIKADLPPAKTQFLRRLLRRAPKRRAPKRRHQFRNKAMTRGVQRALERAQRPRRLAFIYTSMQQGVEAAAERRAAYLNRRNQRGVLLGL